MARTSLNDKMATLKAIDPQTVLQRGFALVYGRTGHPRQINCRRR